MDLKLLTLLVFVANVGAREEYNDLDLICKNDAESFICQEFCEKSPHKCWDLGRRFAQSNVQNRVQSNNINIFVVTFNVGGIDPPQDMSDWIDLDKGSPPDLIAIGLQEMVELKPQKMITGTLKAKKWLFALDKAVPDEYTQVEYVRLIGVFLVVYKRMSSSFQISDVGKTTVGTGILNFGNKGGVGISMVLNSFKLCVINSHLAAGQSQVEQRNKDFQAIAKKMRVARKGVYDHDAVIWMGDMNSRLNTKMTYNDTVEIAVTDKFFQLFQFDQLREQQGKGGAFADFQEMDPNFKPTYKYDVGTNTFDTSKKLRLPAWCDRILNWKKNPTVDIQQLAYTSKQDVVLSDHKPVQAQLKLNINTGDCQNLKLQNRLEGTRKDSQNSFTTKNQKLQTKTDHQLQVKNK